ncbi:MAG: hypothetical protein Q7S92_03635, partial [Candidatus Diapherotrites archaeon]|nr:hypothetical protein [Candidatus Diapherotrites archaeon]
GKALERLRRELKDKTELQKYFQELASQKDNQMSALEEKNQELRLAFKTAEKHEKVLRGQLKGLEKWAEENGWDEEETKNKPKKLKKKKKQ